jgi:RHS repeat-associated protein
LTNVSGSSAYGGAAYSWDGNGDSTASGTVRGAGNRLLSDGTYDYTFDVAGHVTKRVNRATNAETDYFWDNRSRLVSVKDYATSGGAQTQEVDYTYDVFNRLITRVFTPYSGGNPQTASIVQSELVYDGNNVVLAFNVNQALTDRYLWGPAVDQILADEQYSATATQMPTAAGNLFEVLGDNEWNVRDVLSASSGSIQGHFVYDAFGKLMPSPASTGTPIRFMHNGTFYDAATGLEYHGANGTGRWYNAGIQRWMSEDPNGLAPDPNPYRYCNNSPTNFVDPSGLNPPGQPQATIGFVLDSGRGRLPKGGLPPLPAPQGPQPHLAPPWTDKKNWGFPGLPFPEWPSPMIPLPIPWYYPPGGPKPPIPLDPPPKVPPKPKSVLKKMAMLLTPEFYSRRVDDGANKSGFY